MQDTMKGRLPSLIDIEVGRRIRTRRRMLGMSQSALADGLNVTFQQVQKYEKGTNRIGASRLQRAADCLGVPVSHFFDNGAAQGLVSIDEAINVKNDLVRFLSSEEGAEFNRAFTKIRDARTRRTILGLIKSLAMD